jgi:hypothetical protein
LNTAKMLVLIWLHFEGFSCGNIRPEGQANIFKDCPTKVSPSYCACNAMFGGFLSARFSKIPPKRGCGLTQTQPTFVVL